MVNIDIKTKYELMILKEAGHILADIIQRLEDFIKSGISTQEVDTFAEKLICQKKVIAVFKGYRGFPGSICISINEEVIHGIPGNRVIREGDIVSIDIGIIYKGYCSDSAITVKVGGIDIILESLLKTTQEALYSGINQAYPNNRLSDISHAIQTTIESNGFSVVRDFVGHGIGKKLHEDPEIPNFGEPNKGPVLKPGMVFAIEPMVNLGSWKTRIQSDGWTVVTQDEKPSAHFEHTIAITDNGPEILTNISKLANLE